MFNESALTHQENIDKSFHVSPSVSFYSVIKRYGSNSANSAKSEVIELSYDFDGSDLDGKPTYYDNIIIPDGWRVISQKSNEQWQIYHVSNRHQSALVKVSYEIDGQKTSNKRKFKIKRLIKGTLNINQTKLHWSFTPCKTNCKEEIQNL